MAEFVDGVAEWRERLITEIEAVTVIGAVHGRAGLPACLELADTSGMLSDDDADLRHVAFTVAVEEGEYLAFLGSTHEAYELTATLEIAYQLRPNARAHDDKVFRRLVRYIGHTLTPGALSAGAARTLESAPTYELLTPATKGPEWLVCTVEIRTLAHIPVAGSSVPA